MVKRLVTFALYQPLFMMLVMVLFVAALSLTVTAIVDAPVAALSDVKSKLPVEFGLV